MIVEIWKNINFRDISEVQDMMQHGTLFKCRKSVGVNGICKFIGFAECRWQHGCIYCRGKFLFRDEQDRMHSLCLAVNKQSLISHIQIDDLEPGFSISLDDEDLFI